MEVQHTRSGDAGAESVVYTYLLSRGCSEERHYGKKNVVKSKYNCDEAVCEKKWCKVLFALQGLRAAEMTVLPSRIIQEARIIASSVSQQLLVWKWRFGLFVVFGDSACSVRLYLHCLTIWKSLIYKTLVSESVLCWGLWWKIVELFFSPTDNHDLYQEKHWTKKIQALTWVFFSCRLSITVIWKHRDRDLCTTWPPASCRLPGTPGWTPTACGCIWKAWGSSMRQRCRQQGSQRQWTQRRSNWLSLTVGRGSETLPFN